MRRSHSHENPFLAVSQQKKISTNTNTLIIDGEWGVEVEEDSPFLEPSSLISSHHTTYCILLMLYIYFMLFLVGSRSVRSFVLPKATLSLPRSKDLPYRFMTTTPTSRNVDDLLANQLEVPLETAIQLHNSDSNKNVVFFDGSWWLGEPDKARVAYETGPRIAGAYFYDIDKVASTTPDLNPKGLPHMMPPAALQAAFMDACGVTNQHHVIVYGQDQCPFVHRAWYQIMAMGHGVERTHLLAGSLQDWINAGGPVDTQPTKTLNVNELPTTTTMSSSYQAVHPGRRVVSMEELKQLIRDDPTSIQIVDARSAERFTAQVDEPRPGLRRGHHPGAQNIFFANVLQTDSVVQLRDGETLTALTQGLDHSRRIIASCGSGATGCTVLAALVKAGYNPDQLALYDGR